MRRSTRTATAVVAASVAAVAAVSAARTALPADEVRGLWVVRSSLTSPEAIDTMVQSAADSGINTLLIQVRGRGEAFYDSDIEPRASALRPQPASFDPLAHVLDRAHDVGLSVHAWVNVNLVSSANWLPESNAHVAVQHPDWLMVPEELADELARLDPRAPAYLRTLAAWTQASSSRVEGLYLSPLVAAARDHTVRVIRELVDRYPLDGLHLDYVRYPAADFDYGAEALAAFRASRLPFATAAEVARFDGAAKEDVTAWARALPGSWDAFRRDRLTELVARISIDARRRRPDLQVTAAVVPDLGDARHRKMQDWASWAQYGYLDAVCPMVYTPDAGAFVDQVAAVRASLADTVTPMWVGIGAYRLPVDRTADRLRAARRGGSAGVLLFSYGGLTSGSASASTYLESLRATLLEAPSTAVPRR
jgi:uncharacterized lipoprotein YddW (UPF0748 family)